VQLDAVPATINSVQSEPHEEILVWMHLASAGFLNGSYTMTPNATLFNDDNTPKNPYNIYLQLIYDNVYSDTIGVPPQKHNLKTGAQVPVEIISEVDRKIDVRTAGGFGTPPARAMRPVHRPQ
jgi:hypothetical protein